MRLVAVVMCVACAACSSSETEASADASAGDAGSSESGPSEASSVVFLPLDPDALAPEIYVPEPWPGILECDAGDPGDAATDVDPNTRFCSIYFDLFGPTSVGKCQTQYCHGGPVGIMDLPMGWTGKECYDALTTHLVKWLPPNHVVDAKPDGGDSRPTSLLSTILDPDADAGLLMPRLRDDNRVLTAEERARISAWLARGAPFD